MNEYEQSLKIHRDNYSALKSAKAEGIEIGEHKKALEMARQMLADHEPLEKIARYTQLPMEELMAL